MRNKRLILALAGAIVCGLLAVMLVTRYISTLQTFQKDLNDVVVAKAEIPLGAKIVAEQLSLAPMPNGSAPDGVFRKLDEVVGRVAVTPIGLREPITQLKRPPDGVGGGLSAVIPEGYRAMTVKVDNIIGVSGFVMPGSYVDVVAVIVPVTQGTSQGPISKIVLQNIKVLASGAKIASPQDQRQPSDVGAVTLLVTPEQAEKLVLAANEGKLQLVMRNYGDQEDTKTPGANKQTLLKGEAMVKEPEVPSQKTAEEKPATPPKHRPKRASHVAENVDKPAKQEPPPPVSKNSIELIE